MPSSSDLAELIQSYSNCAIAKACGVSDVTVRNWLVRRGLTRSGRATRNGCEVPKDTVCELRQRAVRKKHQNRPTSGRLTTERISRVIAEIGEVAKVVVRKPDEEIGRRIKYASAHNLRRSWRAAHQHGDIGGVTHGHHAA